MCNILVEPAKSNDLLDIAFKSATILIALFNIYFATKIFRINFKKSEADKERDRRMLLLKTLILDHNFKYFYELFDKIEEELANLKQPNLDDAQKGKVDSAVLDLLILFRRKFYDSLLAIDESLYEGIKCRADKFQAEISNIIFDPGVNLSHAPKYEELITEKLTSIRTEIIKVLFSYRGESVNI
jgi:hypothetical protein